MIKLITSIINAFSRKRPLIQEGKSWDDTRTIIRSWVIESTPRTKCSRPRPSHSSAET